MLEYLFTSALIHAAGMTILHSLWQATALALVLWGVSRYTRLGAVGRYRLAFATLLLQAAIAGFTFGYYYEPAVTDPAAAVVFPGGGARDAILLAAAAPASLWSTAEFWLVLLVVCWAAGLLVGGSRLLIAHAGVRKLERSAQRLSGSEAWSVLFCHVTALAERIGYRGTVRIGLTDRIGGPLLIGHLKPILLFPVALVNQLTTEEAETVILHELAHLRRADHLFHLLQCLIEVVFYYHPAVHWIGARIREEREHCCDDLVLRYGPGQLPYARALLYFSEQSSTAAVTALSLTDGGGLLARMRRFIDHRETKYTMKSRLFLLPLLAILTLVGTAAYSPAREAGISPLPVEAPAPALAAPDTLPPGNHQVTRITNGQTTRLRVEGGEIQELELDGRVISASDYPQYEQEVEKMLDVATGKKLAGPDTVLSVNPETYEVDTTIIYGIEKMENRPVPGFRRWPDGGGENDFSPDSLYRIAQLALESVNMDSIMELVGAARYRFANGDSLRRVAMGALDSVLIAVNAGVPAGRLFDYEHLRQLRPGELDDLDRINAEERALREALHELEQRKAELSKEREQASVRYDFTGLVAVLQQEGLLDAGDIRELEVGKGVLKLNGKTYGKQAYDRYLNLYEKRYGKPFTGRVTIKQD